MLLVTATAMRRWQRDLWISTTSNSNNEWSCGGDHDCRGVSNQLSQTHPAQKDKTEQFFVARRRSPQLKICLGGSLTRLVI